MSDFYCRNFFHDIVIHSIEIYKLKVYRPFLIHTHILISKENKNVQKSTMHARSETNN